MAPDPTTSARRHVNAWRDAVWTSTLSATNKLVALAYADHASTGPLRVWVAAERLQARTSLGRTATTAALRRLRDAGWLALTSTGVRGSTTRYALTTPGADVVELEHDDDRVDDVDVVEHQEHEPRAPRQVSSRDELVSPRDERVSRGVPDPLSYPLPHPPTRSLAVVEEVVGERDALLNGVVEEIRSHPLARGLTATAVRRHARELRAAGWTPDDVARELAAQNFTGARGAGLLRYRRTALAQSGPTPPPAPRAADRPVTTTRGLVARDDAAHAAAPPSPETLAAARAAAWRAPPAAHTHERTTAMTTTATPRPTTAARINPDNRLVLAGLLVVLVAVAAASFTLSFTGLSAAAPWAAIPVRLAWLVPVALEVAMLGYVIAAFVRTHRGQSARLPWTLVWALTTVSSAIKRRARLGRRAQGLAGHRRRRPRRRVPVHDARRRPRRRRRRPRPLTDTAPATDTDTEAATDADTTTVAASAGDARCGRRARAGCGRRRARTCAARRGHRGDGHRGGRRTPGRCPVDPDCRAQTRGRAPRRD
ncbi:DUF2637 domain-containing protein [Cellulosimicrobium funkei]